MISPFQGLSPLSDGSIPANLILKRTVEESDTLAQMVLTKDQLIHQSQLGRISIESFWLASLESDQSRSAVSALARADMAELFWLGMDLIRRWVLSAVRWVFGGWRRL